MVAGEESVRLPLCFLLDAEGHRILLCRDGEAPFDFDCIVVDDKTFRTAAETETAFGAFGKPIVLLTDRLDDGDGSKRVLVVQKPLLGRAVTEAVAGALASAKAIEAPPST